MDLPEVNMRPLEHGTDMRCIQELPWHNGPKTTAFYAHVSNQSLAKIKGLLDEIVNSNELKSSKLIE